MNESVVQLVLGKHSSRRKRGRYGCQSIAIMTIFVQLCQPVVDGGDVVD